MDAPRCNLIIYHPALLWTDKGDPPSEDVRLFQTDLLATSSRMILIPMLRNHSSGILEGVENKRSLQFQRHIDT